MDCNFLDLFAGSGNIGIEALSRGAAGVVFVEKNNKVLHIIRENLCVAGFAGKARLICGEVAAVLSRLGSENKLFDIIFLDPPYLEDYEIDTLDGIAKHKLLQADGTVVVESSKNHHLPRNIEELELVRQEKYGDTLLSFYQYITNIKLIPGEGN